MSLLGGIAALVASLGLGALRPGPDPGQKFWEEVLFRGRYFLFMFKTNTVFDPEAFGPRRAGKPVWEFRITDEFDEAAFSGKDTFSQGRAAAIRWAIARENRRM